MSDVKDCQNHGFFVEDSCPECGSNGDVVLNSNERISLSKFMCKVLRHEPGEHGISLDENGWTDAYGLVEVCNTQLGGISPEDVASVVAVDSKGRFEVDGDKIRAAYGHNESLDISLSTNESPVPEQLYHGTAPENVSSIMSEGLKPRSRQLVHLTDSKDEALDVGNRHANNPVLLVVDAKEMLDDGRRVTKRGHSVYTTPEVPPKFIETSD